MPPRRHRHLVIASLVAVATLLLLPRPGDAPRPVPPPAPTVAPLPAPPPSLPEPDPDAPRHLVLQQPRGVRRVGVNCVPGELLATNIDHVPPPVVREGSWLDHLGSLALAHSHGDLVPPRSTRQTLESWGVTPAWVGHRVQGVSPWMGLLALEAERSWNEAHERDDNDAFEATYGVRPTSAEGRALRREDPEAEAMLRPSDPAPAIRLADALGSDGRIGRRAQLYKAQAVREQAFQEEVDLEGRVALFQRRADVLLDVLHTTDDPDMLTLAATQLTPGWYTTTPADDARILEVMERLPPTIGRPMALSRLQRAWLNDDRAAALRWWQHFLPLVEHCRSIPREEWAVENCSCVDDHVEDHLAALMDRGWLAATTSTDRLHLAANRCVAAGHRPTELHVDSASEHGRCIQHELGPDTVLGRDVTLSYQTLR